MSDTTESDTVMLSRAEYEALLDRLDEIGVGAAIKRAGPVGDPGERGRGLQDDDMWETGFDLAADLDAAQVRKFDIEQG